MIRFFTETKQNDKKQTPINWNTKYSHDHLNIYILSSRGFDHSPAQACINELEDELVLLCKGNLLCPNSPSNRGSIRQIIKGILVTNKPFILPKSLLEDSHQEGSILFIASISVWGASLLWDIPEWRKVFDKVCLYIIDSMEPPNFDRLSLRRFRRLLNLLDFIFVPMKGSLEKYQSQLEVPIAYVPLGSSVRRFGSAKFERPIDVMAYGRQHPSHLQILETAYNNVSSARILYYTSHLTIKKLNDYNLHRRFFWKLLNSSMVALAYDAVTADPHNRFAFSFVGQRWFESAAAGCAIVGRRPTCSEMDELFDWEDSTIEAPLDDKDLLSFMEELLMDTERLRRIHQRNYVNSLAKHDWSHRISQIFDTMSIPKPASLLEATQIRHQLI